MFSVETASAGPFVTVLTISGPVENGARKKLGERLADPELTSKRVVVDLTQATLYDSWPLPLLEESAERFRANGGELVLVSNQNATVEPFVGDSSLPGLRWFASLDEAMVELLADVTKLGEWPPPERE
ncbi:MAG TPA: STAS domain-containing protein [Gaiellaceae bacterium]|jgi:anti-anti-sigma regulatory factor|nr:STAS domain-containing protein [Gaiellaceae bacterium]